MFSLVPVIEKTGEVEDHVEYVVSTLLDLKGLAPSIKALTYGVEWLIVDDEQTRNVLGDRMSLMHEYGRNKEDRLIRNQLKEGLKPEFIERTLKSKK